MTKGDAQLIYAHALKIPVHSIDSIQGYKLILVSDLPFELELLLQAVRTITTHYANDDERIAEAINLIYNLGGVMHDTMAREMYASCVLIDNEEAKIKVAEILDYTTKMRKATVNSYYELLKSVRPELNVKPI